MFQLKIICIFINLKFQSLFRMMRCAHYLPCLATMYSTFICFLFRLLSILVCLVFLETCHCQSLYSFILCLVDLRYFLSLSLKVIYWLFTWLIYVLTYLSICIVLFQTVRLSKSLVEWIDCVHYASSFFIASFKGIYIYCRTAFVYTPLTSILFCRFIYVSDSCSVHVCCLSLILLYFAR